MRIYIIKHSNVFHLMVAVLRLIVVFKTCEEESSAAEEEKEETKTNAGVISNAFSYTRTRTYTLGPF